MAFAEATRDDAEEKIAAGAEMRTHQDTILRADALIEILICMTSTDDAEVGEAFSRPAWVLRQPDVKRRFNLARLLWAQR